MIDVSSAVMIEQKFTQQTSQFIFQNLSIPRVAFVSRVITQTQNKLKQSKN